MDILSTRFRDLSVTILRVFSGLLFAEHGAQKLFGALGGVNGHGMSAPFGGVVWLAGMLEFFGGLLLVVGLFTRPVALLLMLEMAYAYFTVHFPYGVWPIENRGELALLYFFIFLFFALNGGGLLRLEGLMGRER